MSELTIAVSVDGIEASAWAPAFRDAMAQAADGIDVAVDGVAVDGVGAGVGTLGTRRGSGVKLTASQGGEGDALLKLVGLVLAALSVAIGATQLGLNLKGHAAREPARPTFVCTIEGPGAIVATDNGDPTDMTPFPAPHRKAFNGLALAIVKGQAGKGGGVTLHARSAGLDEASVAIRVDAARAER